MSDIAIKVEGLGKNYTIQHESGGRYKTLRDTMASTARTVLNRIKHPLTPYDRETAEEFWALKDVSFDIKQGDRVGIIGRNGAGKSTLLKVLSRITEPSTGKITINGRVASLLEVGTGFHPELSGRENIYLNGAILGMKRSEIKRKFDEIVDFAEVEKFLDTPVKRYSSGMYVRLAFAVAAHLEPEILVVDEVLAVGDAEFQQKCLGKMQDVSSGEGRTVLFVSHNMSAVRQLCNRAVLLNRGSVVYDGSADEAIREYNTNQSLRSSRLSANRKALYTKNRRSSGTLSFVEVEVLDANGVPRNTYYSGDTVQFRISYEVYSRLEGLFVSVCFLSMQTRETLTTVRHEIKPGIVSPDTRGTVLIDVKLESVCPKEYILYFWLGDRAALSQGIPTNYDVLDDIIEPLIVKPERENEAILSGFVILDSTIREV